jgi:hypothetical protein
MRRSPLAAAVVAALLCLGTYASSTAGAEPPSIEERDPARDRSVALLGSAEPQLGESERRHAQAAPKACAPAPAGAHPGERAIGRGAERGSRSIPLLPVAERQGAQRAPPSLLH